LIERPLWEAEVRLSGRKLTDYSARGKKLRITTATPATAANGAMY
jgi:hypothetical protein